MATIYFLLKGFLDPVVLVLILIGSGSFIYLKRKEKTLGTIFLVSSIIILYGASTAPVSSFLCCLLEKEYVADLSGNADKVDIVVVLGGGIGREERPSNRTASRILHAVQIFRRSKAEYLVCVGKGGERLTEAEIMGKTAERLGVNKEKIRCENKSQNTRQHAEELNKMFLNKNLQIGLVTSAYHMRRSEREFKRYFPRVFPLPSDYLYSSSLFSVFSVFPSAECLYKSTIALREIIGLAWYKLVKA